MKNDKLYVFCKKELTKEAKEYGLKFDWGVKMWYIPANTSIENIEKLFSLEISLYGRNASAGYMDYTYVIEAPKFLDIGDNGELSSLRPMSECKGEILYEYDEIINLFKKHIE